MSLESFTRKNLFSVGKLSKLSKLDTVAIQARNLSALN